MSDPEGHHSHSPPPPAAGRLNQAFANAVVSNLRTVVGRGPTRAHAFYHHDVVVVMLEDMLTRAERSLAAEGRTVAVQDLRNQLHHVLAPHLVGAIEELTGCRVLAHVTMTHVDPDVGAELFVLDRPVPAPAVPPPVAQPEPEPPAG